jgi:hypothetical protein
MSRFSGAAQLNPIRRIVKNGMVGDQWNAFPEQPDWIYSGESKNRDGRSPCGAFQEHATPTQSGDGGHDKENKLDGDQDDDHHLEEV